MGFVIGTRKASELPKLFTHDPSIQEGRSVRGFAPGAARAGIHGGLDCLPYYAAELEENMIMTNCTKWDLARTQEILQLS